MYIQVFVKDGTISKKLNIKHILMEKVVCSIASKVLQEEKESGFLIISKLSKITYFG